jgi:hypothetical protein
MSNALPSSRGSSKRSILQRLRPTKVQNGEGLPLICCHLFFASALILQQKIGFSLNYSHPFNRPRIANKQHWQRDAVNRWNLCRKESNTSLHLLRLHDAFLFVLCASVAVRASRLSAFKSDTKFRSDALSTSGMCVARIELLPCHHGEQTLFFARALKASAAYSVLPLAGGAHSKCVRV